jgi:exopolyphosphatase/guanosine-5'-triphosphate,3'-diphosphate pyrophosphatase
MNVATLDLGTNTILLLIATRDPSGVVRAVHEEMRIVRLGEGVDKTRRFAETAIARTLAAIEEFAVIARRFDVRETRAVGTSAMRDAAGGEPIVAAIKREFGADIAVISGEREASLTFQGALSGMSLAEDGPVLVFDIGGGSTEIVIGHGGKVHYARSYDLGSVRLTERHVHDDPPSAETLATLRAAIAAELDFSDAAFDAVRGRCPVGIAGTVTTLVAVDRAMEVYDGAKVHGAHFSREALAATLAQLAAVDCETRGKIPGLSPKRADVIVAGALLVEAILDGLGATEMRVSDRGVRWGLAEEALSA